MIYIVEIFAKPNQRWAFIAALKGGDTDKQNCMSK